MAGRTWIPPSPCAWLQVNQASARSGRQQWIHRMQLTGVERLQHAGRCDGDSAAQRDGDGLMRQLLLSRGAAFHLGERAEQEESDEQRAGASDDGTAVLPRVRMRRAGPAVGATTPGKKATKNHEKCVDGA